MQRRDWFFVLVEEMLRVVLWFHPAIWWITARVRLTREEFTDHLAVLATGSRRSYIDALLAFADADGSFDGADLAAVAGPVLGGQADLVVGSRTTGAREPGAMTAFAVAANRALGLTCRLLFGIPLSDLGPFRAIRRDTLLALGVRDRGQGWPLEMIGRAGQAGLRVVEVPVRYRPRAGGASKVSGSLRGSLRAIRSMAAVTCRLLAERLGTAARPAAARRPPAATRSQGPDR